MMHSCRSVRNGAKRACKPQRHGGRRKGRGRGEAVAPQRLRPRTSPPRTVHRTARASPSTEKGAEEKCRIPSPSPPLERKAAKGAAASLTPSPLAERGSGGEVGDTGLKTNSLGPKSELTRTLLLDSARVWQLRCQVGKLRESHVRRGKGLRKPGPVYRTTPSSVHVPSDSAGEACPHR
jgi:hypothetical protein